VLHGLTDTLVSDTTGPAWLFLKADRWRPREQAWYRPARDSIVIALVHGGSRYEYRLRLYTDVARGAGLERAALPNPNDPSAPSRWAIELHQVQCRGMRERQDVPPNRRLKLAGPVRSEGAEVGRLANAQVRSADGAAGQQGPAA